MGKDECDVHGHHHELAMGQIDDPHDAHNKGHAYSDQAVNATDENPCHQSLKEDIHLTFLSSSCMKISVVPQPAWADLK